MFPKETKDQLPSFQFNLRSLPKLIELYGIGLHILSYNVAKWQRSLNVPNTYILLCLNIALIILCLFQVRAPEHLLPACSAPALTYVALIQRYPLFLRLSAIRDIGIQIAAPGSRTRGNRPAIFYGDSAEFISSICGASFYRPIVTHARANNDSYFTARARERVSRF